MGEIERVSRMLGRLGSVEESAVLEEIDRISSAIESRRLVEIPSAQDAELVAVGDIHGDWVTLEALVQKYLLGGERSVRMLTLGDYVDRTLPDLPYGSVASALYVLALAAGAGDRFVALRGNHEASAHVPLPPSDLLRQSRELWGGRNVADRIEGLFERLPLAATAENGIYLAHAGFPLRDDWRTAIEQPDMSTWLEVLWNDVDLSPLCGRRGIDQTPIGAVNLGHFLQVSGHSVFVRGHDPYVAGQVLFHGRLLTVHTTRVFESLGMCYARLPLDRRLAALDSSQVVTLSPRER